MPKLRARTVYTRDASPSPELAQLAERVAQLEQTLNRLQQLQAAQRLADVLDARQRAEHRLSSDELDLITRRVFQAIQRKMARAWRSDLESPPPPLAAKPDSPKLDDEERARITALLFERQARRESKRRGKTGTR